jgi:nucleoside-diphosphate-sugar epimerase
MNTPEHINSNPITPYKSSMEAYCASKTLCRIAIHDFVAFHKPAVEFVNLLPTVLIGPDELATSSEELMGTRDLALGLLLEAKIPEMVGATVHVADVARAHIDALSRTIPGNRSYILSSDAPEGFCGKMFPAAVESQILGLKGSMATKKVRLDVRETEKALQWKFLSFNETVKQLVEQYLGSLVLERGKQ